MKMFARYMMFLSGIVGFVGYACAPSAQLPPLITAQAPAATDSVSVLQQQILAQMKQLDDFNATQASQKVALIRLQKNGASTDACANMQAFIDALNLRITDAQQALLAMQNKMQALSIRGSQ